MKRNSLFKRFAVGIMALSLVIPAVPASAHYSYDPYDPKTDGVAIKTTRIDSLNIVNNDIKVDGNTITVHTNVEFYLDCSVDCDWSAAEGLNIDQNTGKVTIPTNTKPGDYKVTATAKNISTDRGSTEADIHILVTDKPAQATGIELVPYEDDQVVITKDTITVKGTVTGFPIETAITPSYLANDSVELSSNTRSFDIDENSLTTSAKTSDVKITATVGSDNDKKTFDSCFSGAVSELPFATSWEVNDDEFDSAVKGGTVFNIPADKFVYFVLNDNREKTLPHKDVTSYDWELTNNNESNYPSDQFITNSAGSTARAGVITINGVGSDNVKKVAGTITYGVIPGLVTIQTTKDAADLKVPEVQFKPTVHHSATTESDKTPAKTLVLNLGGNGSASVTSVDFNFSRSNNVGIDDTKNSSYGYTEGVDYSVITEDIGTNKDVPVYYMEADGKAIDLSQVIETTSRNVVSFETARSNNFSDSSNVYSANFIVKKLDNNTFGSITDKYQVQETEFWNKDLIDGTGNVQRFNDEDNENDGKLLLHKNGTGYFTLTVSINNGEVKKTIYMRLVSPSNCDFVLEDPSTNGQTYAGEEVVHIRKGEAVQPIIAGQGKAFSEYNEFADITFENLKGEKIADGDIVSVITDNKGNIKINGLKTGFVKVIFTDRVNPSVSGFLYIFVNNDLLTASEYEFNFSDAISKGYMTSTTTVSGKQSKIALRIRAVEGETNIGEWSASDFDFEITNDAAKEYAEIKDGYLITKKPWANKLKLIARVKGSSAEEDIIARAEIIIEDVPATAISQIGVEASNTKVTAAASGNGGTCEAGTVFELIPTELLPANATSNGIVITDWSSQTASVATVEKKNNTTATVTALTPGTTVITAHYSANNSIKDLTYTLTVNPSNKITQIIPANTSITLNRVGATAPIEFTTVPALENPAVEFTAVGDVVDVNPTTGVITAKKTGTTTITITAKDNPDATATITVTVEGTDDTGLTEQAVEDVKALIDAIGTVDGSAASEAKIKAARDAYNKLTDEQKESVGVAKYSTLTTAESTYATAKKEADDKAAAEKAAADKAAADKAAADKAAAEKAAAEEAAAKNIAATKISLAKNNKSKKILVKVKAISGASGYQVRYSLKKNMKSSKTKNITKTSVTLSKLKKGKTYYIQARSVATYNGTKYYSKWSVKKKVKVKK